MVYIKFVFHFSVLVKTWEHHIILNADQNQQQMLKHQIKLLFTSKLGIVVKLFLILHVLTDKLHYFYF
jgi:hypothetical protein